MGLVLRWQRQHGNGIWQRVVLANPGLLCRSAQAFWPPRRCTPRAAPQPGPRLAFPDDDAGGGKADAASAAGSSVAGSSPRGGELPALDDARNGDGALPR